MKKLILILAIILTTIASYASYVGSSVTEILAVSSYNQYGGGDAVFKIKTPIAACSAGYWIAKSDPGFQANLSMILSAYHAKTPVVVYGLPAEMWSGSSGLYCKLYSVHLS